MNSTHIFFSGGRYEGQTYMSNKAYLLEWETGTFVEIPHMLTARAYHACTGVNGDKVIVTGGRDKR